MMNKINEIWNNDEYKCGGFYEIAMQLENNVNSGIAKELLIRLFDLKNISGPFDKNFNVKKIDLEYFENIGIIEFDGNKLPFKTHHFPGDNGINWLDISIYTAMLEEILGDEYQTWNINENETKFHKELDENLIEILRNLNSEKKIKLGILGFEVSAMYEFDWLTENELTENDIAFSRFYINKKDFDKINPKNENKITIL